MEDLRHRLVSAALEWELRYGVAPAITSAVSEYDAARLLGLSDVEVTAAVGGASAVRKGYDFAWGGLRYQVKANRPSGKVGSPVTLVAKARNYDFDVLLWLLYDKGFNLVEAWRFDVEAYRILCDGLSYVRPKHMRTGARLV